MKFLLALLLTFSVHANLEEQVAQFTENIFQEILTSEKLEVESRINETYSQATRLKKTRGFRDLPYRYQSEVEFLIGSMDLVRAEGLLRQQSAIHKVIKAYNKNLKASEQDMSPYVSSLVIYSVLMATQLEDRTLRSNILVEFNAHLKHKSKNKKIPARKYIQQMLDEHQGVDFPGIIADEIENTMAGMNDFKMPHRKTNND